MIFMIEQKIKNKSSIPSFDGDILEFFGCKKSSRKLFKSKKIPVSKMTAWMFRFFLIFNF